MSKSMSIADADTVIYIKSSYKEEESKDEKMIGHVDNNPTMQLTQFPKHLGLCFN